MIDETAETTTEVVVDEAAQAAAAAALESAKGGEDESAADKTEAGETPAGGDSAGAEDEIVVTIGDAAPNKEEDELAKAPEWVRELRKTNREQARRIRELEKTQQANNATTVALGPKPKMSDPDIDYDATKFEEKLNAWNEQKRQSDQRNTDAQAAEKKSQEAWGARVNDYTEAKGKLKVKDFDEAEAVALESLNQVQQGIVVQGADNAALVVYALGKNPEKLKELKAIVDPVKFAFAIAKLEKDLKLTTRKTPPPPEKVVSGSAPKSGVVDSQLERLREEAAKSGDYTKVTAYKRQRRAAS